MVAMGEDQRDYEEERANERHYREVEQEGGMGGGSISVADTDTAYRGYTGWLTLDWVITCWQDGERIGFVTRYPSATGAIRAFRAGREGFAEFYHMDEAQSWVEEQR